MAQQLLIYGALAGVIYTYVTTSLFGISTILFVIYLLRGGHQFMDLFIHTIGRDLWSLKQLLVFKFTMSRNARRKLTIPRIFADIAQQYPRKAALLHEDVVWTFWDLYEYSNAIGNYFYSTVGIQHQDRVAIMIKNCPEFVALWLGIAKIGGVSALINFNLTGDALQYCINISKCKAIVVASDLVKNVDEIKDRLDPNIKFYVIHESEKSTANHYTSLDSVFKNGLRLPPPEPENLSYFDKLLYIYTSGTTGMPKAAVMSHNRFYYMASGSHRMLKYNSDDIVYCGLPMYHSNGGIVGLGQCLCHGNTFSMRTKFSASNFWKDCIKYNATVVLYIGEICRYLLAQPVKPTDRQHSVRMASGNGMKAEIWKEFVDRFNVKKVGEFYGATEGNASLVNVNNVVGSVGFVSVVAPAAYPVKLMRVNEEKELVRGADGLCISCSPGEPGMILGKIIKGSATQSYDGYADEGATNKKVASNVLVKGDSYFISGDILEKDKYGNMYFRDRTGDTFRWKGENVSTAECEGHLAKIFNHQLTVAVYGVMVPKNDGRAGMICIADPDGIVVDMDVFYQGTVKYLPSYARPVFVRLAKHVEVTGTLKIKKTNLVREGFDFHSIADPLYVLDLSQKKYVLMDKEVYEDVLNNRIRF